MSRCRLVPHNSRRLIVFCFEPCLCSILLLCFHPILFSAWLPRAARTVTPIKSTLLWAFRWTRRAYAHVFEAVQQAQRDLVQEEMTKVYMPPQGDAAYLEGVQTLVLGEERRALLRDRLTAVQTPGGCGAVRLGAEVIFAAAPTATVWVSDPTWPVHIPLMGSVGLQFKSYRYYSAAIRGLDFTAMLEDLEAASPGDIVLLHGCCHNPSGVDPNAEQWQALATFMAERALVPMVDFAYQGMGAGLSEDAAGLRCLIDHIPEMIIAVSSS